MREKRKTYLAPEVKVVEIDGAELLSQSVQDAFSIQNQGYTEEEW